MAKKTPNQDDKSKLETAGRVIVEPGKKPRAATPAEDAKARGTIIKPASNDNKGGDT